MMKVKPLSGYALIEPLEAETKTASGIILPDSAQEKPAEGKVTVIGAPKFVDGREVVAEFKVNDKVLYKKWGGEDVKVNGKEYKLVKFEDVMAILD